MFVALRGLEGDKRNSVSAMCIEKEDQCKKLTKHQLVTSTITQKRKMKIET